MSGRISDELINEIIAANDITELIGSYVTLKRSGSGFMGLCPFHKEKTPSFHVSPEKQLYHCFGCNAGGNIVEFVKNAENLDFVESIRFLAERAGINIDITGFSNEDKAIHDKRQNILKLNREAAMFFRNCLLSSEGEKARKYAISRGIEKNTVTAFGLGYAPDSWDKLTNHLLSKGFSKSLILESGICTSSDKGRVYDRFRDRLIFPIIDIRGNVIGFGGRIMGQGTAKYLNSPETMVFNKRKNLFSLNLAKNSGEDVIILVEGYMDVVSLYQSGIKNVVASLGTALTEDQARLISRFASTVVLCYDTDAAGVKATERAISIFEGINVRVKVLSLPDGKDPDEFVKKNGVQAFKDVMIKALGEFEYQISQIEKKYDLSDTHQKIEYAKECAKIISSAKSNIEKDVLCANLVEKTGISKQAIEAEVKKHTKNKAYREKKSILTENIKIQRRKGDGVSDAEKRLVSLCMQDKTVYKKIRDQITPDLFTSPLCTEILEYADEETNLAVLVTKFAEREAEVAEMLDMPAKYENNLKAANEILSVLKRERHERLIKQAIAEGDTKKLNTLLFEKDRALKEEQGNG